VSRFRCLFFAAPLLCSLAGCLLYTDTFNTPPEVVLTGPAQMLRGIQGQFSAEARDSDQAAADLQIAWFLRDGDRCPQTAGEAESMRRSPEAVNLLERQATLLYTRQQFGPFCIWVIVTDRAGASGFDAAPFDVKNQPPRAFVDLVAPRPLRTAGSVAYLPLYSNLRLAATRSEDPEQQALEFRWNITGRDGQRIEAIPCEGLTKPSQICHRLDATGDYRFVLHTWDGEKESEAAELPVTVMPDAAPCIQQTEPSYQLPRLVVFANERTNIQVIEVSDDGDAYPAGPGQQPQIGFIWRYRRVGSNEGFARLVSTTMPSLSFPPDTWRPGDEIEVRLDVVDRVPDRDFRMCGDQPECRIDADRDCRQRVTWRVSYL
jgi:hypothetical protein